VSDPFLPPPSVSVMLKCSFDAYELREFDGDDVSSFESENVVVVVSVCVAVGVFVESPVAVSV